MRLPLLFLVFLIALSGCGGSSSSDGSAIAGKTVSLGSPESLAPPAPGNGVWNYSVATDYFYGNKKQSPSLYADITQYDPNHTAVKYVFPVFGNVQAGANGDYTGTISSSACFTDTNHTQAVFSYYALPQVQDRLSTGSYPTTPITPGKPFSDILGTCITGQMVTDYYKNTVKIPYVVPVVEIPGFSAAIGGSSLGVDQVTNIADAIAAIILDDPNAYGVAFDNETAINKATSNASPPTVNCTGLYYEELFYGRIAQKLAAGTTPKYLFLFDAPETGTNLYKATTTIPDPNSTTTPQANCKFDTTKYPPFSYGPLKNIVLQKALYDMSSTDNLPANGPISLHDNNSLVQSAIDSYLGTYQGPPVTFVLPASATSTMWDSLQVYDLPALQSAIAAQPNLLPPTKIVPLTQAVACNQDAQTALTINRQILSQYLCIDDKTCLTSSSPTTTINKVINDFIGVSNCGAFPNTSATMRQYFDGEISLITQASTSGKSQQYLGSSLYAWRISAMSDISAVPSAYSLLGKPTVPFSTQLFPMNISDDVWGDFINWTVSFSK